MTTMYVCYGVWRHAIGLGTFCVSEDILLHVRTTCRQVNLHDWTDQHITAV
jgi:hypothetical protein